jgi:hypothetical protein
MDIIVAVNVVVVFSPVEMSGVDVILLLVVSMISVLNFELAYVDCEGVVMSETLLEAASVTGKNVDVTSVVVVNSLVELVGSSSVVDVVEVLTLRSLPVTSNVAVVVVVVADSRFGAKEGGLEFVVVVVSNSAASVDGTAVTNGCVLMSAVWEAANRKVH